MDNLILQATKNLPSINFNVNGVLEIKGNSYSDDVFNFYGNLLNWLKEYKNNSPKKIILNISLGYFNTSTSKLLLEFFLVLETINKENNNVNINWYCGDDDEDIIEAIEDYSTLIDVPITISHNN